MKILKNFGIGMIMLGFAFIVPEVNTLFGDFSQLTPTQLMLIITGFVFLSIYFFIKPAWETRNRR